MGTATVQTQHAAERLGLPFKNVRFEYGDSNLPQAPVAGGSNQTVSVALAVQQACEKVQRELLTLAKKDKNSPLAGSHFDDIWACDSGLFRRDKRTRAGELRKYSRAAEARFHRGGRCDRPAFRISQVLDGFVWGPVLRNSCE